MPSPDAGIAAAFAALGQGKDGDAFWALREAAMAALRQRGLPKRYDEEWKYLSLGEFYRATFAPASGKASRVDMAAALAMMAAADEPRVVLVDGVWAPELSQVDGVKGLSVTRGAVAAVMSEDGFDAATRRQGDNPFVYVNRALLSESLVLRVARRALLNKPLHLLHVSTGQEQACWAAPHISLFVEEGAQLTLIESYLGQQLQTAQASTAVLDIHLAAQAALDHVRWQAAPATAYVFTDTQAELAADARWQQWAFDVGARVARHNLAALVAGPGAEVSLGGLYLVDGKRQVDHHTVIDHRVGQTRSRQLYKALVTDSGRAIFNGKVKIRHGAQQTEAHQLCRNLMLSEDAEAYAKPELEIDADDVKCSHGTTVAQVSEQEIFYLQSRGIRRPDALALLSHAFANEALLHIEQAGLAQRMTRLFEQSFRRFGTGGEA